MGGKASKQKPIDIILLVGPTGAGKSTFANIASGTSAFVTRGGLSCCTNEVQIQACKSPKDGRHVLLIDTPAFNHDTLSIGDILAQVKKQLKKKRTLYVTGILYLHRISDVRLNEDPVRHLRIFEELCGPQPARKIVLATTMWADISEEQGKRREAELRKQWKHFISQGTCMKPFLNTPESAWEIINSLLEQSHMY